MILFNKCLITTHNWKEIWSTLGRKVILKSEDTDAGVIYKENAEGGIAILIDK